VKNELQDKRSGFCIVDNKLLDDTDITTYGKLTYIILCRHAYHNTTCFPSQSLIAEKVGCSRKRANEAIAELISFGLVGKKYRDGGSCLYTLEPVTIRYRGVTESYRGCNGGLHEEDPPNKTHLSKEAYMSKTQPVLDESAVRIPWDEVIQTWNETLGILGKPKIREFTDSRKKKFAKLWKKDGMSEVGAWRDFFNYIATIKFLMKTWTRWNFDWVINETNYTKIVEGNYEHD